MFLKSDLHTNFKTIRFFLIIVYTMNLYYCIHYEGYKTFFYFMYMQVFLIGNHKNIGISIGIGIICSLYAKNQYRSKYCMRKKRKQGY